MIHKKGQAAELLIIFAFIGMGIAIFYDATASSYDDCMSDCKSINKAEFQYIDSCGTQKDKNITCYFTNHEELKEYCYKDCKPNNNCSHE